MASPLIKRTCYIAWKNDYSVGEPALDAEHRQIIDLLNELHAAMQQGVDHQSVRPLLAQLVQYTVTHFQSEERVLLAHQYPDLRNTKSCTRRCGSAPLGCVTMPGW